MVGLVKLVIGKDQTNQWRHGRPRNLLDQGMK